MTMPLTLGDVTFDALEVPETIGPLGGKQVLSIHEYPGGAREVDAIGAFPVAVSWKGIFTGFSAFQRAQQVDRMRAVGLDVTMEYGPAALLGKIAHFHYNPAHQFFIPYTITFEPSLDLSGVGTVPFSGDTSDTNLVGETTAITGLINAQDGLALPGSLVAPANLLLDTVSQGLLNGNGTVLGMSDQDSIAIQAAAAAAILEASLLIAGTDPAQASPALDLSSRAAAIALTVQAPSLASRQFQTVNPNLFAIAAQYFAGDTDRWTDIAAASGLSDPQPIGQFTITVPLQ